MKLRPIVRQKFFCGLDVGSWGVKAALVRSQDQDNLDLLGVHEVPSSGYRDSSVSDLTEIAECISRAVSGVGQKCNVKVQDVILGVSAESIQVRRSAAVIPLIDTGTKVISRSDVKKVDAQARLLGTGLEEEIIHAFPQNYKVDDVNHAANPVGLYGRKLESNLLLALMNANRLRNVVKAVHQAGYEVREVALSSYAASEVSMDKALRARGCVLVDIGANMTTVLFFVAGVLSDIQCIPWGGNYLTQSLAERLSLGLDLAEDIKKTHAVASANATAESSGEILIKRERDYLPIRREAVCEAVNWEVENLLTHLETIIKGSPLFHEINNGAVMVGGGSLLTGLMERIEGRLKIPVKLGSTQGLNQAPLFTGAIGLAKMGYVRHDSELLDLNTPNEVKHKFFVRVKELCQEYF